MRSPASRSARWVFQISRSSYPHQLSGGMRQRVGLARALAVDADIILMDEPFSSVDEQTRRKFQEELLELLRHKQKTVIFVTHSIEEAAYLSDRDRPSITASGDGIEDHPPEHRAQGKGSGRNQTRQELPRRRGRDMADPQAIHLSEPELASRYFVLSRRRSSTYRREYSTGRLLPRASSGLPFGPAQVPWL